METPPYIPNFEDFRPGISQVTYSGPFWDEKEINAAIRVLTGGKWLVSGEHVVRFQNEFSRKFNTKHSYMVNSGSSANLAMLAALKKRLGWQDNDELLVSPVGFPTTIAPIVQNGLKPVFVDIEMDTLNFDVNNLPFRDETVGVFVSPVLGNPPNMDSLSRKFDMLIGDNCDSLGTRWNGKLWTEFCYAHSCSFYPAHHITTGQGGMVSSNDAELISLVRSFSSWGRSCYCSGAANLLPCGTCGKRFSNWLGDGQVVDHKYVFENMGYNLAPLDLQGAIGIEQLKKFDEIENKRKHNFSEISKFFENNDKVRVATSERGASPSWFGVPLICRNRAVKESLVSHLEANKIQTRPYFAGNILRHPGFKHLGDASKFPNANKVLDTVFLIGCAPHYTAIVLEYIGKVIDSWKS